MRRQEKLSSRYAAAIDLLCSAVEKGRFCLVLGSGASQKAGAPSWQGLVSALAEEQRIFAGTRGTQAVRDEILAAGQDLPWLIESLLPEPRDGMDLGRLIYRGACES